MFSTPVFGRIHYLRIYWSVSISSEQRDGRILSQDPLSQDPFLPGGLWPRGWWPRGCWPRGWETKQTKHFIYLCFKFCFCHKQKPFLLSRGGRYTFVGECFAPALLAFPSVYESYRKRQAILF